MNQNAFVLGVDKDYYHDPDKSVLDNLIEQYQRVIFSSIVTSFGLDMFIKDQHGGDVDTINTVRDGVEYKNQDNKSEYENREPYDYYEYHDGDENYRNTKHEERASARESGTGTTKDAYTDNEVVFSNSAPANSKASLDHVIAAKTIHDDKGRVLAGCEGNELANAPENLVFTNQSLNSSKGQKEVLAYIISHPELPEDVKYKLLKRYKISKSAYDKKIATSYYLDFKNPNCRRFYFDTAKAAASRGLEMGAREVLGFVLTEVWFTVQDSLEKTKSNIEDKLAAIIECLKAGFEKALSKYEEIIGKFGEGIAAGILSSLSTTLINVFFTTSKNLGRIIRQSWASIVETAKIIFFNPRYLYFCDKMTDAAKVLATGASVVAGTSVQEVVRGKLSVFAIPAPIVDIVSVFCGSLCSGLLTITLLFYIDNDPFDCFLSKAFDETIGMYKQQAREFNDFCARLKCYDIDEFEKQTTLAYDLALKLKDIKDDVELSIALKKTALLLGVERPWDGDIEVFMEDPNSRLVFSAT